MRWNALVWLLLAHPFSVSSQNEDNPIGAGADEWNSLTFTQVDKIYNRSVWTFYDNPALVGFDRKLAVAYRYQMKNLAMGVPNNNGNQQLAFAKHEAFADFAFGGPKENWGLGVYYSHEREFTHTYHKVELAQSFRIQFPQNHLLILGFSLGVQWSKLDDWNRLTFGDMIDPRAGFIYQTNEVSRYDSRTLAYFKGGMRYYWKRFSFDYSVQYGPHGTWALAAAPVNNVWNRFRANYHFYIGHNISIAPEAVGEILTTGGYFYQNGSGALLAQGATNSFGTISGFVTISFKDLVFSQLGMEDFNRLSIKAGYQLKDFLVLQIGCSAYTDETMRKIGGFGSIEGSIRYQIKAWNR